MVLQEAAETAKKALLPPPAAPTIVHAAPASNLPKFGLPDFGGDFIDYLPFMNVFNVEVDTNPHFSDATKFNFLYSCMKGQAKSALDGLSATNENYSVAMDILKDRFGNTKKIQDAHLRALYNLENQQTLTEVYAFSRIV